MSGMDRQLLSGDEAVALGAYHGVVILGTGYPGTPSTEILETFSRLGGRAQWAPNEKVALEVGLGVAYTSARALVTMKHVGLNVAADPLFTAAYTGVTGALVVVSADDPGMSSSQMSRTIADTLWPRACRCWSRGLSGSVRLYPAGPASLGAMGYPTAASPYHPRVPLQDSRPPQASVDALESSLNVPP